MSFPPPPGTNPPRRPAAPTSLPARPPTTAVPSYHAPGISPAAPRVSGYGGFQAGFQPRSVAAHQSYRAPAASSSGYQSNQYGQSAYYGAQQSYQGYNRTYTASSASIVKATGTAASLPYRNQYSMGPQTAGSHATAAGVTAAPYSNKYVNNRQSSTARNAQNSDYDPETEAAIAQWQSAYMGQESQAAAAAAHVVPGATPSIGPAVVPAIGASTPSAAVGSFSAPVVGPQVSGNQQAQQASASDKTVVRQGGGQKWTDSSLLEWDPAHFRLFVGNLAGEVTDESLFKAFSQYASTSKARVIRDKRTEKSKGYGFVSFADGDDYFKAAREMQGKYIGSHPVLLKKAVTEIKAVPVNAVKKAGKKKPGSGGISAATTAGASGSGGTAAGEKKKTKIEHGISKKHPKTRGGLKILG
ncbi:hypothetical protein KEM54_006201 [Ascosphaera aggregata]|nr:hypothetical protein KEM54_006201 [Ascosphaera aggregata]